MRRAWQKKLYTDKSLNPLAQWRHTDMPSRSASLIGILPFLFRLALLNTFDPASAAFDGLKGCPKGLFAPNLVESKEEAQLKVLVPNITSLRQFVNCSDPGNVRGFCIDVFEAALSIVSPSAALFPNMSIHYTCFNFSSPSLTYDDMIEFVANQSYDVVVGDITIGAQRLSMVDFTHKYIESGVVVLEKVVQGQFSSWLLFASPFSWALWCSIVLVFVATGTLVCYLERNDHPEFTQGLMRHRLNNVVWFSVEALVLLERDSLKNGLARGVIMAWLFFVVLLEASYTAGLSSFLTANNLSANIPDLLSLRDSGLKIGYRRGSVVEDFLTQRFNIPPEQLVDIRMTADFVSNLTKGPDHGGVAAVVDELPYATFILSALSSSSCDFGIAGAQLTQEGFGFGFNKKQDLGANFSIALMNLTESGCLQELQDNYGMVSADNCSQSGEISTKVTWKSSFLIFIPLVVSLCLCIVAHCVKNCSEKMWHQQNEHPSLEHNLDEDITLSISQSMRLRARQIELQQYF